MIICCIADLHGYFPKLEGGDLLIIAGDCTSDDRIPSWTDFFYWLNMQKYERKILVAGNHDNFCKQWALSDDSIHEILKGRPCVTYLCDSGTEFNGLKIWGSPWTPYFSKVNPKCTAYMEPEELLVDHWKKIPEDTDILITHSPPYGILDGIEMKNGNIFHAGSKTLRTRISKLKKPPQLWVFGHIHEAYGEDNPDKYKPCIMVNCSHVDENYEPVNKPIRIMHSLTAHVLIAACALGWALFSSLPT